MQRVQTDSIRTHPQNPRRGDVDVIASSLDTNQQFVPIVVQTSTRYVLSGNHTLMAARKLGWQEIDAVLVDVDDQHAYRIMLAANRTAELGHGYDSDALAELLSYLDGDLEGTGFSDDDIAGLITPPQLPDDEPALPEDPVFGVVVVCLDQQQEDELLARLAAEGRRVRPIKPADA